MSAIPYPSLWLPPSRRRKSWLQRMRDWRASNTVAMASNARACCCTPITCDGCLGNAPSSLTAVVAGLTLRGSCVTIPAPGEFGTDHSKSFTGSVNGTFTIPRLSPSDPLNDFFLSPDSCVYVAQFPAIFCSNFTDSGCTTPSTSVSGNGPFTIVVALSSAEGPTVEVVFANHIGGMAPNLASGPLFVNSSWDYSKNCVGPIVVSNFYATLADAVANEVYAYSGTVTLSNP